MQPSARDTLRTEYLQRCKDDARYSLRAFARDLGLSPAFLSQVLSGARRLTEAKAFGLARKTAWNEQERELFLLRVRYEASSEHEHRKYLKAQLLELYRS